VLRERKPLPRRKCSAKVIWEFNPDFQITLDSDPDVCSGFTTLSASVILPVALKPSASNTISTVLHLHNTSVTRKLSVYLDGQRLRHECHPTYLGVTLGSSWRTETTCWWSLLVPPALTLCGHLLCRFAIQQQSTAPQSGHALLTQVRSMCSWTLPCNSSLVPSLLHLSHGFQCSPTLNRQPTKDSCHWQAGGENRQTW